jgi:hypothetical protein
LNRFAIGPETSAMELISIFTAPVLSVPKPDQWQVCGRSVAGPPTPQD